MSTSFAVLFDDKNMSDKLSKLFMKPFCIDYSCQTPYGTTFISKDYTCIIKVSTSKVKFIINGDEEKNIKEKLNIITSIIDSNFKGETIGYKYYGGTENHSINFEGTNANVIELH